MSLPKTTRFLVVDDEVIFRDRLKQSLERRGYEAHSAGHFDDAIKLATEFLFTHAVIDLKMPGKSGLEVVVALLKQQPHLQIVVLTGYGSIATALEATRLGALDYLTKPADTDQILRAFSGRQPGPKQEDPLKVPSLNQVEWEHIQRVLKDCDFNISRAAEVLGINRRSLQRKLQKHP